MQKLKRSLFSKEKVRKRPVEEEIQTLDRQSPTASQNLLRSMDTYQIPGQLDEDE